MSNTLFCKPQEQSHKEFCPIRPGYNGKICLDDCLAADSSFELSEIFSAGTLNRNVFLFGDFDQFYTDWFCGTLTDEDHTY